MPLNADGSVTLGGITAKVIATEGDDREAAIQGPTWRELIYEVADPDADAFATALLCSVTVIGGVGGSIVRSDPHRYFGNESLYCVRARISRIGIRMPDGTKVIRSAIAHVHAHYESVPFDIEGTDPNRLPPGAQPIKYADWRTAGLTRIVMRSPTALKGVTTGDTHTRAFPERVHNERITVTIYNVPAVYSALFRQYAKKLNSVMMFGWDVGCLMFDQYDFRGTITAGGSHIQTVDLEFLAQTYDWNSLPLEDDVGIEKMESPTTPGTFTYDYADLTQLFTPFL